MDKAIFRQIQKTLLVVILCAQNVPIEIPGTQPLIIVASGLNRQEEPR